jgi:hypothetical protein
MVLLSSITMTFTPFKPLVSSIFALTVNDKTVLLTARVFITLGGCPLGLGAFRRRKIIRTGRGHWGQTGIC